jgi:23S rRNA pseudouridine1911/1915/1917 synthase
MSLLTIPPNPAVTFRIRYQDEDLLVVDKPARLVTQPGKGHESDTLLNGLFARFGPQLQNLGRARDFGLLHRLDRQTSGLLIVGLRTRAYDALRTQFEQRQVRKFYWAVASHAPKKPSGVVRRPIVEESEHKKTARISSAGKPALTAYRVLAVGRLGERPPALVECRPVTGRLHQVRVHLDSIGCPILGDDLYGPKSVMSVSPRLALHSHRVVFTHPATGETLDVRSPWPKDLNPVLKRFGLPRPDAAASADQSHELRGDPISDENPGVGEHPAPPGDAEMP